MVAGAEWNTTSHPHAERSAEAAEAAASQGEFWEMHDQLYENQKRLVTGTPTFCVNGLRYDGGYDLESLLSALEG
jgi:protein-disulfide isomerase